MSSPSGESSGTRIQTRPPPATIIHSDIKGTATLGALSSNRSASSDAESRSPALPDMGTVVGTLAPALGSAFGIEGLGNEEDEDDDSGFVDAGKGKKRKRRGP